MDGSLESGERVMVGVILKISLKTSNSLCQYCQTQLFKQNSFCVDPKVGNGKSKDWIDVSKTSFIKRLKCLFYFENSWILEWVWQRALFSQWLSPVDNKMWSAISDCVCLEQYWLLYWTIHIVMSPWSIAIQYSITIYSRPQDNNILMSIDK